MTLPLAHHDAIAALPVFVPALIIVLVVAVHWFRSRGKWDEEDDGFGGAGVRPHAPEDC